MAYGKDTKAYAELTDTPEDDVKKYTKQSIKAEAEFMAQYYGLDETDDEIVGIFEKLCEKLYDKASYTVTKGKGEQVAVKIKPLMVLQQAREELQEYLEEFNIKAYVDGDAAATEKSCAEKIAEICESYIDKAEYAKEVTVELSVAKKDGTWSVSDGDLNKADKQIICYTADNQE